MPIGYDNNDYNDDGEVCGEDNRDCRHPKTGRRSKCAGCGYMSHHYQARIIGTCDEDGTHPVFHAIASYCGADDPMGSVGEVEVYDPALQRDGREVLVSWCCGTPKQARR